MSSIKLTTIIVSGLFVFIVAIVMRIQELYIMSATLLSMPFVSYVCGRIAIRNLTFTRKSPRNVFEGEPLSIELSVTGGNNLLGIMEVHDTLPEYIMREESTPNRTDHESQHTLTTRYSAMANKRGEYTLGPIRLVVSDPLGFFRFTRNYSLYDTLTVLPKGLKISNLSIRKIGRYGHQHFEGTGTKGSGIDFHGVREYQIGDELRRVHWRSTAKYGKLNVIEHEHTSLGDDIIAIDLMEGTEIGTGRNTSLEYAVKIAAALTEEAITVGSSVRLACSGIDGPASTPGYGDRHLYLLLESLAKIQANRKEPFWKVLLKESGKASHGSVAVCLASSIDDKLPECIELMVLQGIEVHFILLTFPNTTPHETKSMLSRLISAGASVTLIECSPEKMEAHIRYDHEN